MADRVKWGDIDSLASTSEDTGDSSPTCDGDTSFILCELVGARNLSLQDDSDYELESKNLRPFCIVRYGDQIIHRSKRAEDVGCNPIWTVSTKSLFLIKACPDEMSHKVLNISVYCKRHTLGARLLVSDAIFMGQVNLDAMTMLSHCDEQRFELPVEDEIGEERSTLGTFSLRFRLATDSDQQFVRLYKMDALHEQDSDKKMLMSGLLEGTSGRSSQIGIFRKASRPIATMVTEKPETEVVQTSFYNAVNHVFSSRTIRDRKTGVQKVRVKPGPDPARQRETQFMTAAEISSETRRPSHQWVEAGSGSLGKLYLEILACHDLPNVDVGEAVGNVTDSFVCAVYEDTCAMTEVIDDELCPHWLPWTQRAFCFGMMHPASILYIGVFDYDLGIGNHEPLGRVAVNVCNLQRNTVYTLKYNLYPSSNVTDRIANGSITIRLRVECPDEKAAILAAIKPRPKIHVNVHKKKSFKVVRYTCFGEYDNEENFDLTVTRSYINEILTYKSALTYCIGDAVCSLIFWRGQVEVFSILLPIHSFAFFCAATTLIERPYLIVPFTLLCVPGVMLATLTIRQQHPSPWNRVPSFWHYLCLLRTGVSPVPLRSIKENEGLEEAQAYERALKTRLEEDRIVAEKEAALKEEIDKIGDDMISTKVSSGVIPIDLLGRLGRYQGIVGRVCRFFRLIKIIVTWEESVVSFWITAGFLFVGIVSFVLPWAFILTWTSRIVVWGFFGPHMKVVDLFLRSKSKNDVTLQKVVENFNVQKNLARLRREEALKLKDMKSLAFGEYNIQVPCFNLARHYDRPLHESSARVCRRTLTALPALPGTNRRVSVVEIPKVSPWIPGQQLHGAMIPRPEHEAQLNQQETAWQKQHLKALEKHVSQTINADGVSKKERLQRSKLGLDTDLPSSLGYEVVPLNYEYSHQRNIDEANEGYCQSPQSWTRLSVIPTENHTMVEGAVSKRLILESDGFTTYDISDQWIYDNGEEEGLEIIALGRLSAFSDGPDDDAQLTLALSAESEGFTEGETGLSMAYKSSDSVQVAFFRPAHRLKMS